MNKTTKKCKLCYLEKPIKEYSKHKETTDKLRGYCKKCAHDEYIKRRRSPDGFVKILYQTHINNSIKRGMPPPTYTKIDFIEWVNNNTKFNELFKKWVDSGYINYNVPSIDRIDDYIGYTFDNIQVLSWEDNWKKGNSDRFLGINTKNSKEVIQYTKEGVEINRFSGARLAGRELGLHGNSIASCCRGALKTTGGFVFKYA